MDVENGTIYWVHFDAGDSQGTVKRPFLNIQSDILNESRLNTVVLLALTDNPDFSRLPGNVTLDRGEANLPKRYVINVSQLLTLEKKALIEPIGAIDADRMREVYEGVKLVLSME